ncbi:Vnx1, partial [Ophiophagus hannah]
RRSSTYVWLLAGFPLLVFAHVLLCVLCWLLVFFIPTAKMSLRPLHGDWWHPTSGAKVQQPIGRDQLRPPLSVGVFAPTLFSKVYGRLVCGECQNYTQQEPPGHYVCQSCHFDLMENNGTLYYSHIDARSPTQRSGPLVSLESYGYSSGGNSRHYFIGVTVLAMVPEIPELINGIQFALQNNLSLSIEIGNCIAVQVCMLQIPILVLFTVFYPTDFILVFSDLHVYASMFSTVLVMVYFILMAVYYFAPSPAGC